MGHTVHDWADAYRLLDSPDLLDRIEARHELAALQAGQYRLEGTLRGLAQRFELAQAALVTKFCALAGETFTCAGVDALSVDVWIADHPRPVLLVAPRIGRLDEQGWQVWARPTSPDPTGRLGREDLDARVRLDGYSGVHPDEDDTLLVNWLALGDEWLWETIHYDDTVAVETG